MVGYAGEALEECGVVSLLHNHVLCVMGAEELVDVDGTCVESVKVVASEGLTGWPHLLCLLPSQDMLKVHCVTPYFHYTYVCVWGW